MGLANTWSSGPGCPDVDAAVRPHAQSFPDLGGDRCARGPGATESVAKCLAATSTTIEQFVALIDTGSREAAQTLRVIGFLQAGEGGHFDDVGHPTGTGWDGAPFPGTD